MQQTVGTTDRVVRVLLGAGAVAGAGILGFATGWGVVLLAVAAILVLTGLSGYCPAYSLLHVDTLSHHQSGRGGHRSLGMHRTV